MEVEVKEINGVLTGILTGRLDTAAAEKCTEGLKPLFDNADKPLALDCKGLEFISSTGLRILLSLLKSSSARKGSLVIKNLSDDVKNVFKITGFSKIFTME